MHPSSKHHTKERFSTNFFFQSNRKTKPETLLVIRGYYLKALNKPSHICILGDWCLFAIIIVLLDGDFTCEIKITAILIICFLFCVAYCKTLLKDS